MTVHPMVAEARRFASEVLRPRAGEFDRDCAVPADVIAAMGEHGFLGSALPTRYGGAGLDAHAYGLLTAEIGKGCSSVRTLLTVHTSLVGETLLRLGSAAQKQHWLPQLARGERLACFALSEPETGSDAAAVRTTYRKVPGGYILSGRKKWISYGAVADLMLVFAGGEAGPTAFLVERDDPGVSVRPITNLLAGRGSHLAEITFDAVQVADAAVLGRPGAGFGFVANTALFHGRYSIAWAGLAVAEAALEEMVAYAGQREQFGKVLREHQLVQAMIANAVAGVHAGRAYCERVAQLRDSGAVSAVDETNIAKYLTSQLAVRTTGDAVQLFGANGISEDYPVGRLYREAKVLEIIEGSTQIQQLLISDYGVLHYRMAAPAVPAPRQEEAVDA